MTAVILAGVGQTPVGEHWELALRDLALDAMQRAILDSGELRPQALFVGNMLAPSISNQTHLGALLADIAGLTGIEAVTLEAAGASGGAALRQGYMAVASGMVEVAMVVGVEKLTDRVGRDLESALATAGDSDFESVQGVTPTAQAALLMQRYMHEYEVPKDGLAGFALTAHSNAQGNPNAMFRKAISQDEYSRAPAVNDPLRQFDVAPHADGAAAIVLARQDLLPQDTRRPLVRVTGSAASIDSLALHDRHDILAFDACRLSTQEAMARAGISLESIDLFEYHDAYGIYAALALEAAGFAERGRGWRMAAEGALSRSGRLPVATMGGLKARGFPGGASGVYQAVEATLQLQARAGPCQVQGAATALIQSVGGPASTAISHVLQAVA
jgi:acetyl-CoA C-acetyltransferase